MSDPIDNQDTRCGGNQETAATPATRTETTGSSISMHDGVGDWCDCCSCEAEPYWLEVAEELGIDLGSDYEKQKGNR
ncbi:MAG: hypothetical protein PVJ39_21320 [Gammaproteobacteria bacterium]|jgi:hypothetical protein